MSQHFLWGFYDWYKSLGYVLDAKRFRWALNKYKLKWRLKDEQQELDRDYKIK